MTEALAEAAPTHGLRVVPSGTDALVLKGYVARPSGDAGAAVVHVWDVYDAAGRRLHRVQGAEPSATDADWSVLPAQAWRAIAEKTSAELSAWLRSRAG